jgi:hypothetical protein
MFKLVGKFVSLFCFAHNFYLRFSTNGFLTENAFVVSEEVVGGILPFVLPTYSLAHV